MWAKPQTTSGPGGFTRYASSTCINHLKTCLHQPLDIQQRATIESPKKQQHTPYKAPRLGTIPAPRMVLSGSRSSQMLPPSLPPSTQFNSPALHGYSAMPSPSISTLPSPLLSALPSPVIGVLPLSFRNYPPTQCGPSPIPISQSLYLLRLRCYNQRSH